ncbi:MAG: redoxin domain-containing protein [Planctomycetia bacterium]|nr:redoxin domain-containing protein [Planctomycetia bacterium]
MRIAFLCAVLPLMCLASCSDSSPPAGPSPAAVQEARELLAKGETFPFTFDLKDVDGKPVKLADYEGKVVIVDFWATWCGYCIKEFPHFVELRKKYQERGFEIVGIDCLEDGSEAAVRKLVKEFVAEHGLPYPCVFADQATLDQVPDFRSLPTTLFIDRTGKVRAKIVGYHELENLEAIVLELLGEKASAG